MIGIVQQIFTLPFLALCGVAPDLHVEALITNMMEFGKQKPWGITSELVSLQQETGDITPRLPQHTHRLHRGGVLGCFKPHSWLTSIIQLLETKFGQLSKHKLQETRHELLNQVWNLSSKLGLCHSTSVALVLPLSLLQMVLLAAFSPGGWPGPGGALPKARVQWSCSPARGCCHSWRRTHSSKEAVRLACRLRWNSISRRRCSSATSTGRSEAPSFLPSLSPTLPC